jgi:AraC-like DNA-binding protein
MKVYRPLPPAQLRSHVHEILVLEHDQVAGQFSLPLFANGTPTLVFSTEPARVGNHTGHLFLFGQTVLPERLLVTDNFKLVCYFLKPGSFCTFFDVAPAELTDRPTVLDCADHSILREHLLNAVDTNEILHHIDRYLMTRHTTRKSTDQRIQYAAAKITVDFNKNILISLQRELCLTERTFQRLFEQYIGVSPNQFRRINQFNSAFRQLNNNSFRDLTDLAHCHGYADQSHFIRTFKTFTAITPSDYLAAARQFRA